MRSDTRQTLHIGVNYLFAPAPSLDGTFYLAWQQELEERAFEIGQVTRTETEFRATRSKGSQLNIQVGRQAQGQLGQLLVVSPRPQSLDNYVFDAEQVCEAFLAVWQGPRQVVTKDATVRHLYATDEEHAFKYLWESRLQQRDADLQILGRPVLGGGLRLVMPPASSQDAMIEVKIESFLKDSTKLYVETQFKWQGPQEPSDRPFQVGAVLGEIRSYAEEQVIRFIEQAR